MARLFFENFAESHVVFNLLDHGPPCLCDFPIDDCFQFWVFFDLI